MKILITLLTLWNARAFAMADLLIDPHVAAGTNQVQKTFVLLGADVGLTLDPQWAVGLGAYYAVGQNLTNDREIGIGPFVSFTQPVVPMLNLIVREDIDHLDQHQPYSIDGRTTYRSVDGWASITTLALHASLARIIGLTVGYRLVAGLDQPSLGWSRSAPFIGFSVGI